MLRIAIDCRMIGSGGIGSYIYEMIPYFLEHNECLLIGTHEQCMDFVRLQNVEFCYCDVKPFSLKEFFNFPPEVSQKINKYDCFFTPYCNVPSGIKVPIFSTIHDVVFLDVKGLTGFLGKCGRKAIYQRAINYSEEIFTVSEFSKSRIKKHLHCKKNITVTYNGIPSYLREKETEKTEKKNQILYVGNIKKHKGLKTLLDAFEIASSKGFDKNLVIVGNKDNFRTGDEETVSRLNSMPQEKIHFTGKISNSQLKELYSESNFLVQPSLYEGFGMPPLESMAVGTPSLISDIEVFKEIYKEFPVAYFKTGNAEDLAEKMLGFEYPEIDETFVNSKYSYKKSAETIINTMNSHISKTRF